MKWTKTPVTPLILLIQSIDCQVVLRWSEQSVVVAPGGSYKLTCACSRFSVIGSSYMHWIYQKPGKGLEWIGRIDPGSGTLFAQSLQGQFSITKDTNKNMLYLEVKSLGTEDTAVYYCQGCTKTIYVIF
uniref:Ig-like domain-containing protein n=1 Tax=Cyprinus carpio TaxID=7962 RepID=A0A8C1JSC6_CYPCA